MSWTTADLLTSVKLKIMAPSSQLTISDADILRLATEELLGLVSPIVSSARAQYYETVSDTTITSATTYTLPYRALGGRIVNAVLIDASGSEWLIPIIEYSEEEARQYSSSTTSPCPVAYIRNQKLCFVGAPNSGGTLRITYYIRPGDLILTTDARQLTAVGASSITMSSALGTIATGTEFDIISNKPLFTYRGIDQTGTVAGDVITVTPPADTVIGDWVAPAGQSPIPQIPYELHPVLTQRTAARCLEILGDRKGMEALLVGAETFLSQALTLVAPRVVGQPSYIVNTNGPFRRYGGRYRRW